MSTPVITRFAPSPTGFLHIGGARTALFNWLWAKHCGGKMLLRIEDTDRQRSTQQAVDAILDGLTWLGLDWDGEPISQLSRLERHREVAEALVAQNKAYYCYASAQELEDMRNKAKAEGRPPRYDGRWRERDQSEAPKDVAPVIRIKSPQTGETIIQDHVQGLVRFPNKDLDDFIILRSDNTPTYMHAVVVDDHDMGVSHIIRGDDHLTNAARQAIIYNAMGWQIPEMAHIPLIHGADGAKLSKRHGALGVEAYRDMGYLPEALLNYLVRLGWSHGDDELISLKEMIEWFNIDGINKSAARFDFKKLESINGHYMRHEDDETLLDEVEALLPHVAPTSALAQNFTPQVKDQLLAAMPSLKERAKTLVELIDNAAFISVKRPLTLEEKAASLLSDEAKQILQDVYALLNACENWNKETLESALKHYSENSGIKLGKIAQPLRAVLTGSTISPGIYDVMSVLGREESLARIKDHLPS